MDGQPAGLPPAERQPEQPAPQSDADVGQGQAEQAAAQSDPNGSQPQEAQPIDFSKCKHLQGKNLLVAAFSNDGARVDFKIAYHPESVALTLVAIMTMMPAYLRRFILVDEEAKEVLYDCDVNTIFKAIMPVVSALKKATETQIATAPAAALPTARVAGQPPPSRNRR